MFKPKQRIIICSLAVLIGVALMFWTSPRFQSKSQPKPLDVWLKELSAARAQSPEEFARVAQQFRKMGTNALLYLAEMLRTNDPWKQERASLGLKALGKEARPLLEEQGNRLLLFDPLDVSRELETSQLLGFFLAVGPESIPTLVNISVKMEEQRIERERLGKPPIQDYRTWGGGIFRCIFIIVELDPEESHQVFDQLRLSQDKAVRETANHIWGNIDFTRTNQLGPSIGTRFLPLEK